MLVVLCGATRAKLAVAQSAVETAYLAAGGARADAVGRPLAGGPSAGAAA